MNRLLIKTINYFLFNLSGMAIRILLLGRFQIIGKESLELASNLLIACGHRSPLDPFEIGSALFWPAVINPWRLKFLSYYLAAKELVFKTKLFSAVGKAFRCIPISRQTDSGQNKNTLELVLKILPQSTIMIFPEGSCNTDPQGKLLPFKPGLSFLVYHSHCQVLPVAIVNSDGFFNPRTKKIKFWQKVTVVIGKPINFDRADWPETYTKVLGQKISDQIKAEIQKLYNLGAQL
ncbi:MAG: lysophospholipid acyltransferase family protein [Candidatus Buchananbacteria bacterium]